MDDAINTYLSISGEEIGDHDGRLLFYTVLEAESERVQRDARDVNTDPCITRIVNVHIITPGQPGVVHLSNSVNMLTSKSGMGVHVTHARRMRELHTY